MIKEFFKENRNIILVLLTIDVLLVVFHIIFPGNYLFNLDFEFNVPTIYQGLKLISIGILAIMIIWEIYFKKESIIKSWFWIFWSMMFLFLGVDEIGQIHENISGYMKKILGTGAVDYESSLVELGYSSTTWLPYYAILFVISTVIVAFFVKKEYVKNKKNTKILIIGWLLLLGVIVVEYINTMTAIMFQQGYGSLVVLEESLEMFGASFLLLFTLERSRLRKIV